MYRKMNFYGLRHFWQRQQLWVSLTDKLRLTIGSGGWPRNHGSTAPITTAQTPAPNYLSRWQLPYPGYFGFTFVQWEEVETRRPSVYTDYGPDLNASRN